MVRGSSKIAKYLNTHPMFKTKRSIAVHDFFEYYERFYESRTGDNAEFWRMMDHAIWCNYDFKHITKADCDKFF